MGLAPELKPGAITVRSSTWKGNNQNDENLVSIQNLNQDVVAAKMFNKEFETRLWMKSREERPRL